MKLITRVRIEGFRSIRDADIEGVGSFTALAGLNNSGKSNVLRALNAFFNEETDPERRLQVDSDYHRPDLRRKRRKRIRVTVDFDLPIQFRFRTGLQYVEDFFSQRHFSITKEWSRQSPQPEYFHNGAPVGRDDLPKVIQFLSLIKFRYIPNRVFPIDVIRNEHQNLRDILVRRLARRARTDRAAFDAIRQISLKMVKRLAERFAEACPNDGSVVLATPQSWQDLAFTFGYKLVSGGIEVEDRDQGSGIQSLLMLETLFLVDRDYFQQFGWRQAAIWAAEEPESSLHASLEARVAAYLSKISNDTASRLQVLCTTHSDIVIQYADRAIIVEKDGARSAFHTVDARTALENLSRAGVSRWAHPILHYPLDPLILVEGKFDRLFFEEAFKLIRPDRKVRVSELSQLDGTAGQSGGDEALRRYIKTNLPAIRCRRDDAPVVVVLDWDAQSKAESFRTLAEAGAPYKVLAWPNDALNPALGKSFKGIERAYSDRIIAEGIEAGADVVPRRDGTRYAPPDTYDATKTLLSSVVKKGLQAGDIEHCRGFLHEILQDCGVLT